MQQRLPSLLDPPIAFAHRGARAHAPDNTIEAFELALRLGATGLESDVWLTADDEVVLDHDGIVRRGRRKVPIRQVRSVDLPEHVPTLPDLLAACGDDFALSLDILDPDAFPLVADVVRANGNDLADRTYLCHPDLEVLTAQRARVDDLRLVDSTRLHRIKEGPERRAAKLARTGIDAINLRRDDWNGGLVVLFHRFGRLAFGWDLQFDHQLEAGIRMGLDAVYSDHVDVMNDVVTNETGGGAVPTGGGSV